MKYRFFLVKYKFCNNRHGGKTMDEETKKYVDSEILRMGSEIEKTLQYVRRDMNEVQKRLKKLEAN